MPTYTHEDLNVFIADGLSPRLPISGLLSSVASFHVKLFDIKFDIKQEGTLFAVSSPDYSMSVGIRDGSVHFIRNRFVASKAIGPMTQSVQILLSWGLNVLQLALIVDNEDRGCVSVDTPTLVVPPTVIKRARELSLLPRVAYASPAEFAASFIEGLSQLRQKIEMSRRSFWDYQKQGRSRGNPIPKLEPQSMALIASLLGDHALVRGYELDREPSTGVGSPDLKAVAPLTGGGLARIAVEGKNAHAADLRHGLQHQLPAYMHSVSADYGVYIVLWFKCAEFPYPPEEQVDVSWPLAKLISGSNIDVQFLDVSLPVTASDPNFSFP
jgi:hypothetical protein